MEMERLNGDDELSSPGLVLQRSQALRVADWRSPQRSCTRRTSTATQCSEASTLPAPPPPCARAKVAADGTVSVPRADVAMDCRLAPHPSRVRSQYDGAVIISLSNATTAELTYARGRAVQANLNDYRAMRMAGAPGEFHVHLVESGGPIEGVGVPGVPPGAAAFANVASTATRQRSRTAPFAR